MGSGPTCGWYTAEERRKAIVVKLISMASSRHNNNLYTHCARPSDAFAGGGGAVGTGHMGHRWAHHPGTAEDSHRRLEGAPGEDRPLAAVVRFGTRASEARIPSDPFRLIMAMVYSLGWGWFMNVIHCFCIPIKSRQRDREPFLCLASSNDE